LGLNHQGRGLKQKQLSPHSFHSVGTGEKKVIDVPKRPKTTDIFSPKSARGGVEETPTKGAILDQGKYVFGGIDVKKSKNVGGADGVMGGIGGSPELITEVILEIYSIEGGPPKRLQPKRPWWTISIKRRKVNKRAPSEKVLWSRTKKNSEIT